MYKRILTILISCAMLSAIALTGCNITTDDNNGSNNTQATSSEAEATDNATEDSETPSEEISDSTEIAPTETGSDTIIEVEDGTFEYEDETVTNPTVAPIDVPDENTPATIDVEVNAETLAGTWKPLMAVSVADNQEVPFTQIYGSSYSQYGGSLVISEDSSFTLGMGAAITQAKGTGTFTVSQNNILVTYADESVDTFLYIPNYQNQQVIKTQLNDYYVYFYKEA